MPSWDNFFRIYGQRTFHTTSWVLFSLVPRIFHGAIYWHDDHIWSISFSQISVELATPPWKVFTAGLEVSSSNRKAQIIILAKPPGVELISWFWGLHCLPSSFLLEQQKYVPVYPNHWPWTLIAQQLSTCQYSQGVHVVQSHNIAYYFLKKNKLINYKYPKFIFKWLGKWPICAQLH